MFKLSGHAICVSSFFIASFIPCNSVFSQVVVHRFQYNFELNSADKAFYDQASDTWIQNFSAAENYPEYLTITYTLKNTIEFKPGRIVGEFNGVPMLPEPNSKNVVEPKGSNENFTGSFRAPMPKSAGKYTIRLKYEVVTSRYITDLKKIIPGYDIKQESTFEYQFNVEVVDDDHDAIDDRIENRLIEKYRPYYKFTLRNNASDSYAPTDAMAFLKESTLEHGSDLLMGIPDMANHPEKSVSDGSPWVKDHGSPNLVTTAANSDYNLKPSSGIKAGATWFEVRKKGNIGLYAHVARLRLVNGSFEYDRHKIQSSEMPGDKIFYKIEYWQFYGYNTAHLQIGGKHDGDWTTVQIIYNPAGGVNEDSIESAIYYQHGQLEIRFQMPSASAAQDHPMQPENDRFVDFRGENFGKTCRWSDDVAGCNNNTIIFAQDPVTKRYTHPVVYIENGGHEPWPTGEGFFAAAAGHNGDDIANSYLVTTPPNLGEVEFPFNVSGGLQILQFNGYWGKDGGPARGPALHWQWTWPENSSVRWRIKDESLTD